MKIAVLGAGVTGLCAALRLKESRPKDISEIVILEEKTIPGGLLQTTHQNGYWWDNGVYFFRWNNYLRQLLPEVFQPIPGGVLQRAWMAGDFRDFPMDKGLLRQQSPLTLIGSAFDYLYGYIRCCLGWDGSNLGDWLRYRLTSSLLKLSRLDQYVSKMQGLPVTELSPTLGRTRLADIHRMTRPASLLRIILFSSKKIRATIQQDNPDIYSFQGGVGLISQKLAQLCRDQGIRIIYGARVERLIRKAAAGYVIEYTDPVGQQVYHADYAVATIPLEELAEAARDQLSAQARADAQELTYLDLKLLFLLVDRPQIIHNFFILYSFEPRHRWKRLLALSLPDGKTAVTIELGFKPGDTPPGPEIDDLVIKELTEEVKLFHRDDITAHHSALVRRAYPVYKLGFEEKVRKLMAELESPRLRLAGRQGRFLYITTPGAVASGQAAAEAILTSMADAAEATPS